MNIVLKIKKQERKSAMICIRIKPSDLENLKSLAKDLEVSVSDIIEALIQKEFK